MTLHQHASNAAALLDWCSEPPHTIDQIVGLHAECAPTSTGLAAGKNPMQLAAAMERAAAIGSSYANPTAAGTRRIDPNDPTVRGIDAAAGLILEAATKIDQRCSTVFGLPCAATPRGRTRVDHLRAASSLIHRNTHHLNDAADHDPHLPVLVRCDLYDTTEWLHRCLLGIWEQYKGDTKPEARQRKIAECGNCTRYRITGTVAVTPDGYCAACARFRSDHKALPCEGMCREIDRKGDRARATQRWITESKAAVKVKPGRARV